MAYNDGIAISTAKVGLMHINRTNGFSISYLGKQNRERKLYPVKAGTITQTGNNIVRLNEVNMLVASTKISKTILPITIKVKQNNSLSIICSTSTIVADKHYDSNILSSLVKLEKTTGEAMSPLCKNIISIKSNSSICCKKERDSIKSDHYIEPKKVTVHEILERKSAYPCMTFVENKVVQKRIGGTILEPVSVSVEDYKPPSIGANGSGSGLKDVKFVMQKKSFSEIILNFTETKIIEVIGLPQGVIFDKKTLKGTPLVAGNFPLQFKFENGNIMEGYLVVPNIPRTL